jgi:hypothetical protein
VLTRYEPVLASRLAALKMGGLGALRESEFKVLGGARSGAVRPQQIVVFMLGGATYAGTQFTCFTGTKVQILMQKARREQKRAASLSSTATTLRAAAPCARCWAPIQCTRRARIYRTYSAMRPRKNDTSEKVRDPNDCNKQNASVKRGLLGLPR